MKYSIKTILSIYIAIGCLSCNSTQKKEVETAGEEVVPATKEELEEPVIEPPKQREPFDDEIREYGRVVGLEDGAYPMFIISIEFPERKMFADFNLNIESIAMTVEELNNLNNKYVTLYYTSELDVNLRDLQLDNVSVLGDDAFMSDNAKEIIGILSGAETATVSDLPGKITITPSNGEPLAIEYYVTEEMTSANGQEITAFYSTRSIERLTYLELSENQGE